MHRSVLPAEYEPAAQLVHTAAPAVEKLPNVQAAQPTELDAPVAAEDVPKAQGVQLVAPLEA